VADTSYEDLAAELGFEDSPEAAALAPMPSRHTIAMANQASQLIYEVTMQNNLGDLEIDGQKLSPANVISLAASHIKQAMRKSSAK